MNDHFPIVIDVEEAKVGSVLRQLDAMPGVVTIHLRMAKQALLPQLQKVEAKAQPSTSLTTVKATKKLVRAMGGRSVREIIAKALAKGSMHKNILAQLLQRNGLSPMSVHSALTKMGEDKLIERIGPGTYRLTKRGIARFLEDKPMHEVRGGGIKGGNNAKGLRSIILKALEEKSMDQPTLKDFLVSSGYASNNMYNMVPRMREEGLIRRVDDTYEITERGRVALAPDPAAEEVNHGPIIEHDDHLVRARSQQGDMS